MTIRLSEQTWILQSVHPRNYKTTYVETYLKEDEALTGLVEFQAENPKFHYILTLTKTLTSTS